MIFDWSRRVIVDDAGVASRIVKWDYPNYSLVDEAGTIVDRLARSYDTRTGELVSVVCDRAGRVVLDGTLRRAQTKREVRPCRFIERATGREATCEEVRLYALGIAP